MRRIGEIEMRGGVTITEAGVAEVIVAEEEGAAHPGEDIGIETIKIILITL